jgi:hypothetical protein
MEIIGLVIAVIVVLLSVSGAGLNKKLNKIHTYFSVVFFSLAFLAFIDFMFNNGALTNIVSSLYLVPAFIFVYVVLWLIQLSRKLKNTALSKD